MRKYILSFVFIFPLSILFVSSIKVCKTFQDYSVFNFLGHNCMDNPILNRNITEIIRDWPGFTAEEYYLTTEDGYIILVERAYRQITQKHPIIIAHGLGANALGWVDRGEVSLARLLGNLGYDVWMLNVRGTWYSKGHVNLTTSDKKYWKFTIDHVGLYDIRSMIKLVAERTKRQAIYIGYSMGTTGFYMYSSTYPEEAKRFVKGMISLAPVYNYKNARSVTKVLLPIWPLVRRFVYAMWNGEVLPGYSIFLRPFIRTSAGMYLIQFFCNFIFGDDFYEMDPLTYPIFATQILDTGGVELFSQLYQFLRTSNFTKFDYGKEKNLNMYGTATAPRYDLSKIPVPFSLFVGENDWLATLTNAKDLMAGIRPELRCGLQVVPYKKWTHLDFLIAKDLPKYLYKYLFQKIEEFGDGICRH
ncbi:lipase member K-like isoform X1 [Diorhabda carinulata]|uniref:lipase member K-like isoform X1 n=1 Tax=Diorhabda carinulata TaxID=1163345 RepID=UPI0025A0930B|nr:lipase member K-like isoform X1 [Diorhabda carinulata]